MNRKIRALKLNLISLLMWGLIVLFLFPFYIIVINSFKSFSEIIQSNLGFPEIFHWENYLQAWVQSQFHIAAMNSLIYTYFSVMGIVLLSSMAAYRLARFPTRFNKILYFLLIASMIIPFQSLMFPLIKVLLSLDLIATRSGLIIAYWGFGVNFAIFLYYGFIKMVPKELEEAAIIDGCSQVGVFGRIVLPLLKPITMTVITLNCFWIWNDFLLPFILIGSQADLMTIPVKTYRFYGQYMTQWELILPMLVLGVTPIIFLFLFLQRHIIEGITAGSVKG